MASEKKESRTRVLASKAIFAALTILKENGGELPTKDLYSEIEKRLTFDEWDLASSEKTGGKRWMTNLHVFSIDCVKAGFIEKKDRRWYLTPEGENALSLGASGLLDEATRRYRIWEATEKPKSENKGPKKDSTVRIADEIKPLSLIGTWKEVVDEHESVEEAIKQRGGWASWWSFPIEEEAQKLLITPFYIYLNSGSGVFSYRMKVEEYKASRGNDGIQSPWPLITDENCKNSTRAGNKQSEVFKTWLKISEIEELTPPLTLDDMTLAESLSHSTNVLNQKRFGYVYLKDVAATKTASASFWWVNQGASYEVEKNGNYIFAPLKDAGGGQPSHWSNVSKVKNGDMIFHYAKGALRAVSRVFENAVETERPDGTGKGEKGLLVKTNYHELLYQLPLTGIPESLRVSEKGPFNVNGAVNQGYLFPLSLKFVSEVKPFLQGMSMILNGVVAGPEATSESFPEQPEYSLATCVQETGLELATLERWVRAIERKGQAVLYGPPGTGKTYVAERMAKHLVGGGNGFVELVQFHPTYSYEDFIQGIRPKTRKDGGLDYPLVPGRFLEFCEKAKLRSGPCVLILDEINRANLSRVFGELMYLLEYRDKKIPLSGGESFGIPSNVRLIGTMNTADRSIALVDHALRRRFAFLELYPNYNVLEKYHADNGFSAAGLIETLKHVNKQIGDHHYMVGISFFLRPDIKDHIEDIWRMEIEPYLEEYFFDHTSKVDELRWTKIKSTVIS